MSQLQFDETGKLIVPESIQEDLENEKKAKEQGMTSKEYKSFLLFAQRRSEFVQQRTSVNLSTRKFTDNELEEYHARGYSDEQIAQIFGCCHQAVWNRRCKLKLVANFPPKYGGENLTEEELEDRYKAHLAYAKERAKTLSFIVNPKNVDLLGRREEELEIAPLLTYSKATLINTQ